MAGISTAVALTDRVTGPLNNIINALNMTVAAFDDVNAHSNIEVDLNGAREQLVQAQAAMAELGEEAESTADSMEECNEGANKLVSGLVKLAGAYLTLKTAQKVISISDEFVSTTARVDNMNDAFNTLNGTAMTTDEVIQRIYQSAQNARGSFGDMAAVVAKFGNNARDAFSSQDEVIAFANLVQKQMKIAGASTQEASNAMLQLSQALGSGVLRGDELNSIFEQAPNLIQNIADYMGVSIGQIRTLASEGKITADIVKAAMFDAADDINTRFEKMPKTWGDIWTSFQNQALMSFQPVLTEINNLANSEAVQGLMNGLSAAMNMVAGALTVAFQAVNAIAQWAYDNWSLLAPVVAAVTAVLAVYAAQCAITAAAQGLAAIAQAMLNSQLLVTVAMVAAVVAAIVAFAQMIADCTGVCSTWLGVLAGGISVVIAGFKNILSAARTLCSNMIAAFSNAISSVQGFFYNLLSTALSVIATIAEKLNALPFVNIDVGGLTAAADSYAAKASAAYNNKQSYESFDAFQDGWAESAFNSGAEWGDSVINGISEKLGSFGGGGSSIDFGSFDFGADALNGIDGNTGKTAANTSQMVSVSDEQLKYLRDIAEQDVINRFTTAEIAVTMTNNNSISSSMDLDGMISSLTDGVREAMEYAAEGV